LAGDSVIQPHGKVKKRSSNPFNARGRKSIMQMPAKARIRYNGGRKRKAPSPKSIKEALSE